MSAGGMRVLLIGTLAGELAQAARIAIARGAKLEQADTGWTSGLARLRDRCQGRPRAVRGEP